MKRSTFLVFFAFAVLTTHGAAPNLTIYNAGFAAVRDSIPLVLQEGQNEVRCPIVSPLLDPASVMLRDPAGKVEFRILEQKFRANALTEQAMLARAEGGTLPFQIREDGKTREVTGKIIRAGYWRRSSGSVQEASEPIIEIDGRFVFSLPGTAMFPKLPEDALLKPELVWKIGATAPVKIDAELAYLTDGLGWDADYNVVMADDGKISQLIGWITLRNETGIAFDNARVKLVAGNVKRIGGGVHKASGEVERVIVTGSNIPTAEETGPSIQRRTFDEYHEYTLPNHVTLADSEMTQVELVRAANISATRSYIYDGSNVSVDAARLDYPQLDIGFAADSNSKIAMTSEFKNDATNHLGVPLPQGRVHFYRPDSDGHPQFTGDSGIDNTPQGELVRAVTGYAFDLVGERKQTDFRVNEEEHSADESFEIKIRNHRKDGVEVRVWEHPCRWRQWEITAKSQPFKKVDQKTFEFVVSVGPDQEKMVSYTIRYSQLPPTRR
jgi:hypothetical protein